ncbi:hypothetical protein ACU6QD_07160 [Corynebacterium glucuronolyticum]
MNKKLIGFFKPFDDDGNPNTEAIYNAIKEATQKPEEANAHNEDTAAPADDEQEVEKE